MSEVIKKMADYLDNYGACMLCIIGETKGATPRKIGSKMIVAKDGKTFGSVGGGELEFSVTEKARHLLNQKICSFQTYQLSGSVATKNAEQTGMVCGGQVTIVFLYLDNNHKNIADQISSNASDENNYFCFQLNEDGIKNLSVSDTSSQVRQLLFDDHKKQDELENKLDKFGCYFNFEDNIATYAEKITAQSRIIIFGAGHISAALAPIMKYLGYIVVVYDPRNYLIDNPSFKNVDKKIISDFAEIESKISISSSDNIVVATPSHADDFDVLLQVLNTKAKYIGCLGSVKKTAIINKKLLDANFSDSNIKRIDSPIGINIGAQTPKEIAISIAAKIIDCNNVKKDW